MTIYKKISKKEDELKLLKQFYRQEKDFKVDMDIVNTLKNHINMIEIDGDSVSQNGTTAQAKNFVSTIIKLKEMKEIFEMIDEEVVDELLKRKDKETKLKISECEEELENFKNML